MEQTALTIKDNSANPAPLGLFGFGLTTILLNLHNAGIYAAHRTARRQPAQSREAQWRISLRGLWRRIVRLGNQI